MSSNDACPRRRTSVCTLGAMLLCFLLMAAGTCPAAGKGFVGLRGPELLAPDGNPLLLRGINLGNWLVPEGYMFKLGDVSSPRLIEGLMAELLGPDGAREFWHAYRASYITREDIHRIRALGLNSVRVPFNYRLFVTGDSILDGPGYALLDSVIAWSRQEGLWVILDMHCAPGGQTGDNIDDSWGFPWLFESAPSRALTIAVWRRLAARYAAEQAVLGYDLLNEPIATFEGFDRLNPLLEPLYRDVTRAIREVDTNHIVILGGAQWDTNFDVFGPPFDSKTVYTFHRYWSGTGQEEVQKYADFRQRHQVPVWMGESGENTDAWIDAFRKLLERNTMGWCFWPYKKMNATTCLVTFDMPEGYGVITDYARAERRSFEQIRKRRPAPEEVRSALDGFLRNCRSDRCRLNEGYARALGLTTER